LNGIIQEFKLYINNGELFNLQARDEFQTSSGELTVEKLIDSLVQSKTTGTQKPGSIPHSRYSAVRSASLVPLVCFFYP